MWNFNLGVLVFRLEILIMGVKNICRISEDEALFCLEFPKLRYNKSGNSKSFREPQQITFIKINRFRLFIISDFLYLFCHFPFLCFLPQRLCYSSLIIYYSSLTLTRYKENMLTNQASLKKSICEKMFHITYIKKGVAPSSFLAVSNNLILVNCKKMFF